MQFGTRPGPVAKLLRRAVSTLSRPVTLSGFSSTDLSVKASATTYRDSVKIEKIS